MTTPIDPNTLIGVVSLTVGDLERSVTYYQRNIGLTLQERDGDTAVLGTGDRNLLRLTELAGARSVRRATGLFHFALLTPTRLELARTLRHLIESDTPIAGASDHLVSEALYLSDPDGHGIEIYRDRPRSEWYDGDGNFRMDTLRLDVEGLMAELAQDGRPWAGIHPDTIMGHIHLQVADVDAARHFYTQTLGFEHMTDYPSASFVGAGGYHHHIGMNSWMGAGAPPPPADAAKLLSYELLFPNQNALTPILNQLKETETPLSKENGGWVVQDPSQNNIHLQVAK